MALSPSENTSPDISHDSLDHYFSSPESLRNFLYYINNSFIDMILTYHSGDVSFDLLLFLTDYIDTFNKLAQKDDAYPARVKTQMYRWLRDLSTERYFVSNAG